MSPEALTKLERYRFIAQVTYKGSLSAPFALGGVRVEDVIERPAAARPDCERRRSVAAPRRSAAEVAAHLDGLDDRILAALRSGAGNGSRGRAEGRKRQGRSGPVRVARRPE